MGPSQQSALGPLLRGLKLGGALCSLNPEFLEPAMHEVMTELMAALWAHLRPSPISFGKKVRMGGLQYVTPAYSSVHTSTAPALLPPHEEDYRQVIYPKYLRPRHPLSAVLEAPLTSAVHLHELHSNLSPSNSAGSAIAATFPLPSNLMNVAHFPLSIRV